MAVIIPGILNNGQITEASIADGSVTTAKLGTDAVTTTKILNQAVSNAKLQYDSVTLNSQTLALGGTLTLDTDDISEGGNLYFTDGRAISAVENEATLDLTGEVTVTGNVSDKITTIGDFDLSGNANYKSHGFNVAGGNEAWATVTFTEHEGNTNKPLYGVFPGFTNAGLTAEVWGGSVGNESALGANKRLFGLYGQGSYDNGGTITQPSSAPARFIMQTTEQQTSSGRGTKMDLQTTIQGSTTRVTTASFNGNETTLINLLATGEVVLSNLPTSDPGNPGQLWNDGGTLKVS